MELVIHVQIPPKLGITKSQRSVYLANAGRDHLLGLGQAEESVIKHLKTRELVSLMKSSFSLDWLPPSVPRVTMGKDPFWLHQILQTVTIRRQWSRKHMTGQFKFGNSFKFPVGQRWRWRHSSTVALLVILILILVSIIVGLLLGLFYHPMENKGARHQTGNPGTEQPKRSQAASCKEPGSLLCLTNDTAEVWTIIT